MNTFGHISHPRTPLSTYPYGFTSASSPARFVSHHPSWQQHNSSPEAFISIKASSTIQIKPLLFSKTTLQHNFPKLKNKPLIYNFSKSCCLNHFNSCLCIPLPNNIRLSPVPSCSQTGATLHLVS